METLALGPEKGGKMFYYLDTVTWILKKDEREIYNKIQT